MNIKAEQRYDELYKRAVSRYLDKTDFDASEWLDKKEQLEFKYYREMDNGDIEIVENLALSIAEWNEKNPNDKIELLDTLKLDI